MYGEQILYYNVLFDCRQIMLSMSPVFVRGHCADSCIQLFFHLTRQAQALDKSRPCGLGLWGFMKLHVVFGSSRAGEAV